MATILDYLHSRATILHPYPPNVYIVCPACDTRKKKCSIHVGKGIGACFRASCDFHGGFNFPQLIARIQNISLSEAYGVAAQYSEGLEYEYKSRSYGKNRNYPKGSLPIEEFINYAEEKNDNRLRALARYGVSYLELTRKLTGDQMIQYQLGIGYEDQNNNGAQIPRYGMIVIPIFFNNEIVSYTSRSIDIQNTQLGRLKHYFPKEDEDYLLTGQILFNCDRAIPAARKSGNLIIVEDAWCSIKMNCCSSLGTKLTEDQLFIILNNFEGRITLLYDNDAGGIKAADSNARLLARYRSDIYVAKLRKGVDPDEDLAEAHYAVQTAKPFDPFQASLSKILYGKTFTPQ